MTLAVPHVVRNYQMQQCLEQGFEHLQPVETPPAATISIVGYGPSLLQTWRDISYPVMSLSGAHDFLIERGIVPDFHADCDPRIHKSSFVKHPRQETTYLMASCCHPQTWAYLRGRRVKTWHADNGPETQEWLRAMGRADEFTIRPGPSIGTAGVTLAKLALRFRKARLFGFDSCFRDEQQQRAGPSDAPGMEQPQVVTVDGVPFLTNENMRRQAAEFPAYAEGLEIEIMGPGLLKALLEQKKETA